MHESFSTHLWKFTFNFFYVPNLLFKNFENVLGKTLPFSGTYASTNLVQEKHRRNMATKKLR